MSISLIKTSELVGSNRLDPEYYQPHYQALNAKLKSIGAVTIDSFADANDGFHESPVWVDEDGIPCISAKCVKDNYFVLTDVGQVNLTQRDENPTKEARVGDVLLTSVGTIGNSAVAHKEMLPAIIDRHVGIIRIRQDADVDPYYLATFLNSKYGRFQTLREATGNVQLSLFIEKIQKLLVPTGKKYNEIGEMVRVAYRKSNEAEILYSDAKNLLSMELGLNKIRLTNEITNVRTLSDVQKADRIDAEFFQKKFDNVLVSSKRIEYVSLETLTSVIRNGKTPSSDAYSEAGVPILKVSSIQNTGLVEQSGEFVPEDWARNNEKGKVERYDCLMLCAAHHPRYIGKTGLIMDNVQPLTRAVGELIIIRFQNQNYQAAMSLYFNHPLIQEFIQRLIRGNTAHLYPDDLATLPVPIISQQLHENLFGSLEKIYKLRTDAKRLLAEAKEEVEKLILRG